MEDVKIFVSIVKQGKGNSNTGNIAQRFFENPNVTSEITDLSESLISRMATLLNIINSVSTCHSPEEYREASKVLFDQIVEEIGEYGNMSPTVHRYLVHGHVFLDWAKQLKIPLGRFSESAVEYRNKDRRKARLKFSRKNTRLNNIKDMYHYLIKTSDPVVNSFD